MTKAVLHRILKQTKKALEVIMSAIGRAGYKAGEDFKIAIDAASSEWIQDDGTYLLPKSGIKKDCFGTC